MFVRVFRRLSGEGNGSDERRHHPNDDPGQCEAENADLEQQCAEFAVQVFAHHILTHRRDRLSGDVGGRRRRAYFVPQRVEFQMRSCR